MSDSDEVKLFTGSRLIVEPGPLEQGFRFSLALTVRFADLDSFGHVNNAVFLTYCEQARIAYFSSVTILRRLPEMSFILAHSDIDYRSPVFFGEPVRVLVRATRVGTKSCALEYRVLAGEPQAERLAAEAHSVQVMYNYEAQESIPVPAVVGTALERFEGRGLRD